MGPERRSMVMHEDEKTRYRVSRSRSCDCGGKFAVYRPCSQSNDYAAWTCVGFDLAAAERDRISMYKDQMLSQLSILFGGRIAEDIYVGRISTGASNDFERATQIAREMVTRFGMSEKMGVMVYAENEGEVFLGRSVTRSQHISEKTQQEVDAEVRRILDEQYAVAYKI